MIVALNGLRIGSASDLRNRIGIHPVDEAVHLELIRDGSRHTVVAHLRERGAGGGGSASDSPLLEGVALRELPGEGGVEILELDQDTVAWRSGLRPGDVIVAANRRVVRSMSDLESIARESPDQLLLRVQRSERYFFIVLRR